MPGESVIHQARLHWIVYDWAAVLGGASVVLLVAGYAGSRTATCGGSITAWVASATASRAAARGVATRPTCCGSGSASVGTGGSSGPDRVLLAEYVKDAEGKDKLVGGIRWLHETQYDLDGLRSKNRVQQAWDHIEKCFPAPTRVTAVTPVRLDAYASARLAEGAARQTVNNELAALRRGLNLAVEKGLLATAPKIKLAKVENAREGFFEEDDFAAVLLELPTYAQPIIRSLRVTGWRVMEALGLTWDRVDWERKGIRLSAHQTKAKKARLFPFGLAPDLNGVLEAAWQMRDGPFVFQRNGKPIGYTTLVHQWQAATKRAGCTGRLIHDLRRTAARDFRAAGVDEGTIMALCGWKTRAMFDRHNILNDADLAAAVAKRYGIVAAESEGSPADPDVISSSAA